MFKTLNNGYQSLLTSTVEINIYVVKIIFLLTFLYKIHIEYLSIHLTFWAEGTAHRKIQRKRIWLFIKLQVVFAVDEQPSSM